MSQKADLLDLLVHLPGVDTVDTRKAFASFLGLTDLANYINWEGSNVVVFPRLVDELSRSGQGRLVAFLEAWWKSSYAGVDREPKIVALRNSIQALDEAGWQQEFGILAASSSDRIGQNRHEKLARLHAMVTNYSGFIRDRLANFVGRKQELLEIHQRITDKQITGGYITITGHAGQGKSSVIAKLVDEYGTANVAHHFIPFNPGPDHQVELLRNLMAHIILKYDLSEFYVATDSRSALRSYFKYMLAEIASKGTREIIFIDGLDQIEEDISGARDLSFLPEELPQGIVFVLGTRPNETLKSLELRKSRNEYKLPPLSRDDFDLMLERHGVPLDQLLGDQFYTAMQQNALYLALVTQALSEGEVPPEKIIHRVANNPENLFSLAVERLQRNEHQWNAALKPILGSLLVACRPLSLSALRTLITLSDDMTRKGLQRLGGLVVRDGAGYYGLYHRKFHEFLRQDTNYPEKDYVFAADEEIDWHRRLADWCERNGLDSIWSDSTQMAEQERRIYAREHYVTHLYQAQDWEQLWVVLDTANYGRAKCQWDPTTRSYALDLDLGRRAAISSELGDIEEGIQLLPRLWKYSLLRCRLASRVDAYSDTYFTTLAAMGEIHEAVRLAELLTFEARKVRILLQIGLITVRRPGLEQEALQSIIQASSVAHDIIDEEERAEALLATSQAFVDVGYVSSAYTLVNEVADLVRGIGNERRQVMLIGKLIQAGQLQLGVELARQISDSTFRDSALASITSALAKAGQLEAAAGLVLEIRDESRRSHIIGEIATNFLQAGDFDSAVALGSIVPDARKQAEVLGDIARALAQAEQFNWALNIARKIEEPSERAQSLSTIAVLLMKSQGTTSYQAILEEALDTTAQIMDVRFHSHALVSIAIAYASNAQYSKAISLAKAIQNSWDQAETMAKIAEMLAQADEFEQAMVLISEITHKHHMVNALATVAQVLIQSGTFEQVVATLNTIVDEPQRNIRMAAIAEMYAKDTQTEQAIAVVQYISNDEMRVQAYTRIAHLLANLGQISVGANLLEDAADLALKIDDKVIQDRELSTIARSLADAGRLAQATAVAQKIEERWERGNVIAIIAQKFAQFSEFDQAIALANAIAEETPRSEAFSFVAVCLAQDSQFDRAISMASDIESEWKKADTLIAIAQFLSSTAQIAVVRELFDKARVLKSETKYEDWRQGALIVITRALAEAGYLHQVVSFINNLIDKGRQGEAFASIVQTLTRIGQCERGAILARELKNPKYRDQAFASIMQYLAETKQFDLALTYVHEIADNYLRAESFGTIARSLAQAKQFALALTIARSIESQWARNKAVTDIAEAMAQGRDLEQALAIIRTIDDTRSISEGLATVAKHAVLPDQMPLIQNLLDEATTVARTIEKENEQIKALTTIGVAFAHIGLISTAISLVNEIANTSTKDKDFFATMRRWSHRDQALCTIAASLAEGHHFDQAISIAETIHDDLTQTDAYADIAAALARCGQITWAEAIIRKMRNSSDRDKALTFIALRHVQDGQLEEAIVVSRKIADRHWRSPSYNTIAQALHQQQSYGSHLQFIQQCWLSATDPDDLYAIIGLAYHLIVSRPNLGMELIDSVLWVDNLV